MADEEVKEQEVKVEQQAPEVHTLDRLKELKKRVSEDDTIPVGTLTLRKILGGDILTAELVRRNIWTLVLVVFFTVVYVAFRYQCQQDMILIDKMEGQLKDAKYKALSSSSVRARVA